MAQDVRISGTTTVNYVELRPMRYDSILTTATSGDGLLRHAPDGSTVQCVDPSPYCYFYGNGATASSAPALQDLRVSAWGFGRGARFYADLRGRAVLGGSSTLWPQANDHFDALEAYLELERPRYRLRVGRQWDVSGLAFGNYDGAAVLLRPSRTLSVEAYGGSSLVAGINEAVTNGALAAVEPFAPQSRGILFGVRAQARPLPPLSLSAVYERTIAANRDGLYSERAATNGVLRGDRVSFDWAAQFDFSTAELNELRGQFLYAPSARVSLRAFVRRHQPYFDLWTIWGAFGAVGFAEGGAGASWRSTGGGLTMDASASRRHYLDTGAKVGFAPLRASGWTLNSSSAVRLTPRWGVDAQYAVDFGFGTARSQGALRLRRTLPNGNSVGISGTAFQTADEMRIRSGTVVGIGLDGAVQVTQRGRLTATVFDYHHAGRLPDNGPNWSQLRASLTYSWTLGAEPGMPAPGGM